VVLALDVDGVLLDPDRGGLGPWPDAFSARFGVDAHLLDEAFFQAAWSDVIVGRAPIEPALAGALDELGWSMDVEEALHCWFEADAVLDPAVVGAALQWAGDGARLVLASNQEPRRARFITERLGAVLPLQGGAFSGTLGLLKSDPRFYGRAERQLGLDGPGATVVFVDDSMVNVAAATGHGWHGIHFDPGADWRGPVDEALARYRDGMGPTRGR
jgi:putative hydrolase of the HAD superfamily